MIRAEIVIRALDSKGEVFDFSHYVYNHVNEKYLTQEEFEKYLNEYSDKIAMFACSDTWEKCDFISVIGIRYENVE